MSPAEALAALWFVALVHSAAEQHRGSSSPPPSQRAGGRVSAGARKVVHPRASSRQGRRRRAMRHQEGQSLVAATRALVGRSPGRALWAARTGVERGQELVPAVSSVLGSLEARVAEELEPKVWAALRRAVDRAGVGGWDREPARTRQQRIDALERAAHIAGVPHG